jgi:hypothetical protein
VLAPTLGRRQTRATLPTQKKQLFLMPNKNITTDKSYVFHARYMEKIGYDRNFVNSTVMSIKCWTSYWH